MAKGKQTKPDDFIPALIKQDKNQTKFSSAFSLASELKKVIDLFPEGVMITDLEHNVIMVNKWHALLDYFAEDELVGKNLYDLNKEGYYTELTSWMRSKDSIHMLIRTKNNRVLLVTGKIIWQESRDIAGWFYTLQDVHDFSELKLVLEKRAAIPTAFNHRGKQEQSPEFIYKSKKMQSIFNTMLKVCWADSPIIITGESGTGKDVIARKIHELSNHAGRFVHVNCPSIPETLFESELFGYETGAFTGAKRDGKPGLFEMAENGTIFLDEIGDLSYNMQSKLLQVMQDGSFRRVGGTRDLKVTARVISATNQDLKKLIADGKFRADLYYRLCVIPIHVPPLRERTEDIPILADHFLQELNIKYGIRKQFSQGLVDWMLSYSWPGNVRELKNLVERLFVSSSKNIIQFSDLGFENLDEAIAHSCYKEDITLEEAVANLEKLLISRALKETANTRDAAKSLGISQSTLLRKAHKYGIDTS